MKINITLTEREHAMMVAALRYWQRTATEDEPEVEIATDDGAALMTDDQIDDMVEGLMFGTPAADRPRIVVTLDGGVVQAISQQNVAAGSLEVITVDYDTEGTTDGTTDVGGDDAIVARWAIDDLDPTIAQDIDAALAD